MEKGKGMKEKSMGNTTEKSMGNTTENATGNTTENAMGNTTENAMENATECGCHKTKERSREEYRKLLHRLNRIEGQIRGIKSMVEKNAYCTDILMQVSAVNAALNSFNKELLAEHIRTCVTKDIREGNEAAVEELLVTLQKLMK